MTIGRTDTLFKVLASFLNQEIHLRIESDESLSPYTLMALGKDFIVVNYGESQRIIPVGKIIFVQIGLYPKEAP